MADSPIKHLVHRIRTHDVKDYPLNDGAGMPHGPMFFCSEAPPPIEWDQHQIETQLRIKLPQDMIELWAETAGLQLFIDKTYGQWGLRMWSPEQARERTIEWRSERPEFLHADFIIGEFLGDSDLLVIRCNKSKQDYGAIVIAEPIDPRREWPVAAPSLTTFLQKFCDTRGEKYWERQE